MITNFVCLVTSLEYPHATLCTGYFPRCNNNRKSDAESWRWMVVLELERPRNDPRGYGPLFVDAFRKAGWGNSISHSCSPSCEVRIVALENRLSLSIATMQDIKREEELNLSTTL